jgi:hypothetical protein
MKVYQQLASSVQARLNCQVSGNAEWFDKHGDTIEDIQKNRLPSGSGIDNGCQVDLDKSNGDKIVIHLGYHHMNENGFYDGWTEHTATITPSFDGIDIKLSGRDRNDINDYLADVLYHSLTADYVA